VDQQIEVLLNGEVVARFQGLDGCMACTEPLHRIRVADASLLRRLWRLDRPNEFVLRVPERVDGYQGAYMYWLRVRIGSGTSQPAETRCLYDASYIGGCANLNLCFGGWNEGAIDQVIPVAGNPHTEETLSRTSFSNSTLPHSIDLASVPDGPFSMCVAS